VGALAARVTIWCQVVRPLLSADVRRAVLRLAPTPRHPPSRVASFPSVSGTTLRPLGNAGSRDASRLRRILLRRDPRSEHLRKAARSLILYVRPSMPARRAAAQSAERRGLPRARAVRVGCLTGDRALRERGEEALLGLEQRLPQLPGGQAGDLQTVLFHTRYVLREQIAIDADLREIRALDVPMRHQGALAAYGTIQRRAARTRRCSGRSLSTGRSWRRPARSLTGACLSRGRTSRSSTLKFTRPG
jgi:hypothetical protein